MKICTVTIFESWVTGRKQNPTITSKKPYVSFGRGGNTPGPRFYPLTPTCSFHLSQRFEPSYTAKETVSYTAILVVTYRTPSFTVVKPHRFIFVPPFFIANVLLFYYSLWLMIRPLIQILN